MDELEERIAVLREQEDLMRLRPALDGTAVMELLDIKPSRAVGEALEFLMEIRLDEGEISEDEAAKRLLEWWGQRN
jgi:poly(A) polymerase